jgi:hypothetical protein
MSPKKTMLVAALSVLVLCSCGTQPTKTKFPEPPEILMREPESLAKMELKQNPVLSDVAKQHAEEALLTNRVREHVLALQDWIVKMQKTDAE